MVSNVTFVKDQGHTLWRVTPTFQVYVIYAWDTDCEFIKRFHAELNCTKYQLLMKTKI